MCSTQLILVLLLTHGIVPGHLLNPHQIHQRPHAQQHYQPYYFAHQPQLPTVQSWWQPYYFYHAVPKSAELVEDFIPNMDAQSRQAVVGTDLESLSAETRQLNLEALAFPVGIGLGAVTAALFPGLSQQDNNNNNNVDDNDKKNNDHCYNYHSGDNNTYYRNCLHSGWRLCCYSRRSNNQSN
eukprot:TCALIF_13359-PA protein Name:"Protein of unknown function" AED:0.14 eAED:0.14 QI:35/0.5/0.33/1/0/0/3/0/181